MSTNAKSDARPPSTVRPKGVDDEVSFRRSSEHVEEGATFYIVGAPASRPQA